MFALLPSQERGLSCEGEIEGGQMRRGLCGLKEKRYRLLDSSCRVLKLLNASAYMPKRGGESMFIRALSFNWSRAPVRSGT
jgi:hypothetical protein